MGAPTDRQRVCHLDELPPGGRRVVETHDGEVVAVFNCGGRLFAIDDRCSHGEGRLGEGAVDPIARTVECPRHGSRFDLLTGRPLNLPAYAPVDVFVVEIDDDVVHVLLDGV